MSVTQLNTYWSQTNNSKLDQILYVNKCLAKNAAGISSGGDASAIEINGPNTFLNGRITQNQLYGTTGSPALVLVDGMQWYNTDLNEFEGFQNNEVVAFQTGVTGSGASGAYAVGSSGSFVVGWNSANGPSGATAAINWLAQRVNNGVQLQFNPWSIELPGYTGSFPIVGASGSIASSLCPVQNVNSPLIYGATGVIPATNGTLEIGASGNVQLLSSVGASGYFTQTSALQTYSNNAAQTFGYII